MLTILKQYFCDCKFSKVSIYWNKILEKIIFLQY